MAENTKELVVYFSRKGYVRKIAEKISEKRGADIFELTTSEHTRGKLAFWWCGRFAMHRWGMSIIEMPKSLEKYDNVIICSPVWAFAPCSPVLEFAKRANGKIKSAEYVFVHFSALMKYPRGAARLDLLLNIRSGAYESVMCMWGRVFARRRFNQN